VLSIIVGSVPIWGCGGEVRGNARTDASTAFNAEGTTADGSSEGVDVDGSRDGMGVDGLSDGPSTDGSYAAGPDADSGLCIIAASNYDQSCNVDSDCVEVSSGDYCSPTTCTCGGSAINVKAMAEFNADVANTPLGSNTLSEAVVCGCPLPGGPCCRSGVCQSGFGDCSSPADTLPACADAGGTCMPVVLYGEVAQCHPGPCAYADEVCCVF
jgi:hypothetical protein